MKLKQTDESIAGLELAAGVRVRDYGCLTVTIYNILKFKSRIKVSFSDFLDDLKKNGAFTENGCLIWKYVEKRYKFTHRTVGKKEELKRSSELNYIVQVKYKNTGHFCDVIDFNENLIWYFDVYDGSIRSVGRGDEISIRELRFEKEVYGDS